MQLIMKYYISTDNFKLDRKRIHKFITNSYWAKGIPYDTFCRSLENSLNFGVFHNNDQVGYARVVTDYATFAYLGDVYIEESHRGNRLSTMLLETIFKHSRLQGLRRWMLATLDAHGLYEKFGFKELSNPKVLMEKYFPDIYLTGST